MVCREEYLTRLFRQASLISMRPVPQGYAQLVRGSRLPNGVPLEKPRMLGRLIIGVDQNFERRLRTGSPCSPVHPINGTPCG